MIKGILDKEIKGVLAELGFETVPISFEHPGDLSHGDYAINVAMMLAKKAGKNPVEIAGEISEKLKEKNIEFVSGISIAGPGFINFTLSPEFFAKETKQIIKAGSRYGVSDLYKGRKILVEHSSPNLFKPFHVGHVMNNAIGESISRIAKVSGAEVVTMSFPSDISLGVAKAIFILLQDQGESFKPTDISILGDAYVKGTKLYDEDESIHFRVKEIADNLYGGNDSPELRLFNLCKKFNIEYFENIVARLGSHFDTYIYESEAGVVGKKIVDEHKEVFAESDGAIVYVPKEEDTHLNTAVFINSQGNPTYEAKDLGLLKMKFEKFSPDISIFMTDNQQISHFQIVLDAAEKINKEWKEKSIHKYHGRMSFKGQKMSSRLGGVPLATDLIEYVTDESIKRMVIPEGGKLVDGESTPITDKELSRFREIKSAKEIGEKIAIAALKFAILKSQAGKNIDFDPETSLSFEGDSGPYIQYTIARSNSILEKAKTEGVEESLEKHSEEVQDIERLLYRFPEVVETSIKNWEPHHLAVYGLELARAFNSFYGNTKFIDKENKDAGYNLSLVRATSQVLKNTLRLLGIESPEKM